MFNILKHQYLLKGQDFDNLKSSLCIQALLKTLTFLAFRKKNFEDTNSVCTVSYFFTHNKGYALFDQFKILSHKDSVCMYLIWFKLVLWL